MLSTSCGPLKPEGHLSSQNLSGEMAHRCALVPKGAELWDLGGWLVNGVCPTDRNQKCRGKRGFVLLTRVSSFSFWLVFVLYVKCTNFACSDRN